MNIQVTWSRALEAFTREKVSSVDYAAPSESSSLSSFSALRSALPYTTADRQGLLFSSVPSDESDLETNISRLAALNADWVKNRFISGTEFVCVQLAALRTRP